MTEGNKIFQKMSKVMSLVSRVPKNGYNSFHKYHYATETDLTESIRPILEESGLAFFSNVLEQERSGEFTKVKMEFTLADLETGETLKSTYWGEGQDKGDKGLYKAYTGATKYFLMKTFLIPTGDDPEQDPQPDKNKNKGGQQNSQPPNNNYNNNTSKPASNNNNTFKPITDGQKKAVNAAVGEFAKLSGKTSGDVLAAVENTSIGKFGDVKAMSAGQASNTIALVNKWIKDKKAAQGGTQ